MCVNYIPSLDDKKFLSITKDTDRLLCTDFLGELGEVDESPSWIYSKIKSLSDAFKAYNSNDHVLNSYESESKRVLRRLSRPIMYVGGALAAVFSLSTASAQTPPEKQINDLPALVEMEPGDYRTIFNDTYVLVYTREDAGGVADITIRGKENISFDLAQGESIRFGLKTSASYEDYDPEFIVVNMGINGNRTGFWITPTFSSKMLDVYQGFRDFKNMSANYTENDLSNLSMLDEDADDARSIIQGTKTLLANAANMAAADERKRALAINYVLSAESVYGDEYRMFNQLGFNNTPFIDALTRVHDVGIGSVRDDVWMRNMSDANYAHAKSQLFADMALSIEAGLLLFDSRLLEARVGLQHGNNISAEIDRLSKVLETDEVGFESNFANAIQTFEKRASGIGQSTFVNPDQVRPIVNTPEKEDDTKEIAWGGPSIVATAAILAAMKKKYNGK